MEQVDEFYVCDICGEPMPVPDNKVSFKRSRYFFTKEDPSAKTVKSYDLCKNCYEALNGCIRNMIINSKKKKA